MTKRLVAVTGEYISKQDNQQKAEYTEIGVIITGKNNKEYALLDPSVNLAGVLMKQNALAAKRNEPPSSTVMVSLFDQEAQQPQQGGYQQQPQGNYQQAPAQGYNPPMGQQSPQGGYQRR